MPGVRTQLVWAGAAIACYLLAGVAFLWAAFRIGLLSSSPGFDSLGSVAVALLVVSLVLFALGGYAMSRVRRASIARPEESALPPQYRSGPGPSTPESAQTPRMSPEELLGGTQTGKTIRCPNCGAENDPEYTFCQQCSANLSE